LATNFQAITHPDDLEADLLYVQEMLTGKIRSYQMEKRYLHKQGRVVLILLRVSLVRDIEGRPVHFIAQIEDVSERNRVEQALQRSEERYRYISELSSDYAYSLSISESGTVAFDWTTAAMMRITGYTDKELEADLMILVHPDDMPLTLRRMQRLMAGEEVISEYRIVTKDGRVRWVRYNARPIWDERLGRVTRLIAAVQDITDRKESEAALCRSEKHFRALIERATDLVGLVDGEGTVRYVSPSLQPVLGYRPDEWEGRKVVDLIHPADLTTLTEAFRASTEGKDPGYLFTSEYDITTGRGASWNRPPPTCWRTRRCRASSSTRAMLRIVCRPKRSATGLLPCLEISSALPISPGPSSARIVPGSTVGIHTERSPHNQSAGSHPPRRSRENRRGHWPHPCRRAGYQSARTLSLQGRVLQVDRMGDDRRIG